MQAKGNTKMRPYKKSLRYDPGWKGKYPWIEYDPSMGGMFCSVCKAHGTVPVQSRGAWVTRPVSNWVKATSLLLKHDKSEWHIAAKEKRALSLSTSEHGSVVE